MTLDEVIQAAMRKLSLGSDEYATRRYAPLFTDAANLALLDLSKSIHPVTTESVTVTNGVFLFSSLTKCIRKLIRIVFDGAEIHSRADGDTVYLCKEVTGSATVTYEYYYDQLVDGSDQLPIPAAYQRLIPIYVAAEFCLGGGDDDSQNKGTVYMSLYQQGKKDLVRRENGTTNSYLFKNRLG